MKTIERYVFGSFLTAFFLAWLVLSFVLTIGLMVQITQLILQGLPMKLIGLFAFVSFPETLQWTMPIALLVSSMLVFSRMSADSEIAAMRACGINLLSVMKWPILFGVFCAGLGLYVNNEIVPRGHEVRRNLKAHVSVDVGLDLLEPGRIIDDFPKLKVYFERKEGNWLYNLMVVDYSNNDVEREITATKALVTADHEDVVLDMYNVTVDPVDVDRPGMAVATRLQHRIKDAMKKKQYIRKEKDFRFFEIIHAIRTVREETLNAPGSSKVRGTMRNQMRRHGSRVRTEFQKRWVFAMASICFVLVGMPLGIRAQRKESSIGMALSLAVALVFYLAVILVTTFDRTFSIHPEFLIWLPVIACGILATYLIPKNL